MVHIVIQDTVSNLWTTAKCNVNNICEQVLLHYIRLTVFFPEQPG